MQQIGVQNLVPD